MLELDCHLTRDGEVVVSHDQNLLRSTGIDKNISELDYKDLPLLKMRLPIDFDPGIAIYYFKKSYTYEQNYLRNVVKQMWSTSVRRRKRIDDLHYCERSLRHSLIFLLILILKSITIDLYQKFLIL